MMMLLTVTVDVVHSTVGFTHCKSYYILLPLNGMTAVGKTN